MELAGFTWKQGNDKIKIQRTNYHTAMYGQYSSQFLPRIIFDDEKKSKQNKQDLQPSFPVGIRNTEKNRQMNEKIQSTE